MEAEQKRENRLRWFWGICLVILWGCAIALFVRANGHLSVQELLRYQPENKVLAAFAMWGLFLLKSVDFVIYSGLLYAIDSGRPLCQSGRDCDHIHGPVLRREESGQSDPETH